MGKVLPDCAMSVCGSGMEGRQTAFDGPWLFTCKFRVRSDLETVVVDLLQNSGRCKEGRHCIPDDGVGKVLSRTNPLSESVEEPEIKYSLGVVHTVVRNQRRIGEDRASEDRL